MYKVNKFCDYILTRPSLPEDISKVESENTKMKQAIEAIAFMARTIQKKEKEVSERLKEKEQIQVMVDALKRERDYLKKNVELMSKADFERKRTRHHVHKEAN